MRKIWLTLAVILAAALSAGLAGAEEASSINAGCAFSVRGATRKQIRTLTDDKYSTYISIRAGGEIGIDLKGQAAGSILLQFYDRPTQTEVRALVGQEWVTVAARGAYLSDWVELPEGAASLKVVNTSRARLMMAELTVFGTGDRPDRSPEWQDCGKADLMVFACHPDDELLWLGGLLPTYAGERGLSVMVVYAVPSTPVRRLELLDGLWHCGVTNYPAFMNLPDRRSNTLAAAYKHWSKNRMCQMETGFIRQYRPEVVVTHDLNGEYGHGGHRAVADTVRLSVGYAADASRYAASAGEYGTWQVKKLYLHLYAENQIQLDWHTPLARFGGRDGMTVATEALAMHRSQVANGWAMEEGGACDNTLFGLCLTAVGPDEAGDDLFEHILPGRQSNEPEDDPLEYEDLTDAEWPEATDLTEDDITETIDLTEDT